MRLPLLAVLLAATGQAWAQCKPVETRPPNARAQQPAFEGQTRACEAESEVAFDVQVLAKGLVNPWAVEPLHGGDLLVTEKPGRLRIVSARGELGPPIAGVPKVDARGQGGLLDVALSPKFEADRTIWRIGSVTKVLTAVAVLQLVDRGLLDLDADVNAYLREFTIASSFGEPVRVRALAGA